MRSTYLNRMGITQWQLRNEAVSEGFFQVRLMNGMGKTLGVMIARINEVISVESQEQLLRKIAESITVDYDCDQCESLNFGAEKYCFIIQLGDKLNLDAHLADRIIHSYSLSDMINYPDKKKSLWIDIKKLRELFNE